MRRAFECLPTSAKLLSCEGHVTPLLGQSTSYTVVSLPLSVYVAHPHHILKTHRSAMEEDHDGIHTDETSTSPSKNTQDNDGEHQLEEQSIGEARDLAEPTEDNSKEEVHVQGSSKSEKDTDTGNNEGSSMSALAKKEERLKRLRELHLRRVRIL